MNARGVWGVLVAASFGAGGVWLVGSCGGSSDATFANADAASEAGGDGATSGGDGGGDGSNPPGCPASQPSGACAGEKNVCTYGCESCFCQAGQWQCTAPGCAGGCFPSAPTPGTQCGGCCGVAVGMSCDYACPSDAGTFRATCVGSGGLTGTWTVGACASSGGSNPGKVTCAGAVCNLDAGQECCDSVTNDAGKQTCGPAASGSFCTLGAVEQCDEKADCTGANVCCLQFLPLGIQAACIPTCVTGAQRYQACKTSAECESGTGPCTTYSCKNGETVQTCTKPLECQ